MFNILFRALILFVAVFFVTRLLGKRQIGELQPYEFVFALMAADLASVPMSDLSLPLLWGIIAIFTLGFCAMLISFLGLKSIRLRKLFCGVPCVLVAGGVVQEKMLRSMRYTISDLTEQLRTKNIFSLTDVNYAILETNGEISVLLNSESQPVTPKDLNIKTGPSAMGFILISDGKIIPSHLEQAGKNRQWVEDKLKKEGFTEKNIFLLHYLPRQELHYQTRGNKPHVKTVQVNE